MKTEWTEADIQYIKDNYGYRTKMALCRHFGVTEKQFNKVLKAHQIRWRDPRERKIRVPDLSAINIVYRKVGSLLVGTRPGRIDEVEEKYREYLAAQ